MMNRAYSILNIKSVDESERIIEGIASTPSTDRQGDIIESLGAKFNLPMPLLWQHRSSEPVGWVEMAQPTDTGIPFQARIAKVDEPGELKKLTDKAWQSLNTKPTPLVRGVSIGFKINKDGFETMKGGGWRITDWEWLELSLVTIPANQDATISLVRSLDEADRADKQQNGSAAGTQIKPIKISKETTMPKTIQERLKEAETSLTAKATQAQALLDAADDKGETLDAEQDQRWIDLKGEIDGLNKHIGRLRDMEQINLTRAIPVIGTNPDAAAQSRNGTAISPITVRQREVEPWVPFVRMVIAQAAARGNIMLAHEIAKSREQWMVETPQVAEYLKAAVSVGTTTDAVFAGPLVQYANLPSAFAEYLRGSTIIGRIPGLRRVPFKVRIPRMTGASTVNWVGEGRAKPLSSLAFDTITMDFAKIAGIVPLTEESIRLSTPNIETIVRDELAGAITAFMDSQFIDPSKAANDVSPASITNGAFTITPSGTTAAALRSDIARLMATFLQSNQGLATAVWIMTQTIAMRLSMLVNTLGQPEFPSVNASGGTFAGLPVITSENIPSSSGSPDQGWPIILAKADEILLADDGQVTIDASREASLQMESAPDSPPTGSTVLTSLWQHNMVGIKAERFINWRLRRNNAVVYISNAIYTG
jgi:HK97 family phage major capsid protein/HK97 family phage prohead protease